MMVYLVNYGHKEPLIVFGGGFSEKIKSGT